MRHGANSGEFRKSFLICHRGALGDFILTWPALRGLRKILPNYHFLGLGRIEYMRLAVRLGLLDSCFNAESARMLELFCGTAIPPEIGNPAGSVLWLSEGQELAKLLQRSASLPVVVIKPFPETQIHIAGYYCLTLQNYFPIKIPEDLSAGISLKQTHAKRRIHDNYILIHPGSGSPMKNYAPQFYRNVADELRRYDCQKIGFILGPVEQERHLDREFAGEWVEQPEHVEELARLLIEATLYIGNDSGASHLAGILGTPAITLYKTTNPKVWGVLGREVVHLCAQNEEAALCQIRAWLKNNNVSRLRGMMKAEMQRPPDRDLFALPDTMPYQQ